ncbi:MAG: SDR family oxidoreductase [Acidobacteria bacterium]|nr:SDR family oxidoreductase [Acidobacteriota bacterium]
MTGQTKVAVLTGAGGGIGRAVALRLAADGTTIVGHDIDVDGLAETGDAVRSAGAEFLGCAGDISQRAECHSLVASAVEKFGGIDVFGCIAGISNAQHFADLDEATWSKMMSVNTSGVLWCSQAAIPHLIERNGALINVASNAGLMGQAYNVAYTATKAAVVAITRSTAMEFMKSSIRINAIAPAGVDTPLTQNFKLVDDADWSLIEPYAGHRGMSKADDIAGVFAFLASDDARSMHGAIVATDLGSTAG